MVAHSVPAGDTGLQGAPVPAIVRVLGLNHRGGPTAFVMVAGVLPFGV